MRKIFQNIQQHQDINVLVFGALVAVMTWWSGNLVAGMFLAVAVGLFLACTAFIWLFPIAVIWACWDIARSRWFHGGK